MFVNFTFIFNLDTEITTNDHYQAHRLSYWANLLPQLHQPGISKTKQQQLPEVAISISNNLNIFLLNNYLYL